MVRPANLSTSPETTLKALLWRISTPLMSSYCTDPEKLLCSNFLFVTCHILTTLVLEKVLMLRWTKCSRWCLPKQTQQRGQREHSDFGCTASVGCSFPRRKYNVKHDTVSEERDKYLKEKPSVVAEIVEPSREMANNICAKTKREWRRDALTVFTLV